MGQAFDAEGVLLGDATGATKREVFDKLSGAHPDAEEIRVRSLRSRIEELEGPVYKTGDDMVELPLGPRLEQIARTCHEVNREYCRSLGDLSQPSWEGAPDWQRLSARAGVRAILEDPTTTPEQSHEGWLALKKADGWVYGPVKNPDRKEHPCMLPYAELSLDQRLKDSLFGAVVRSFIPVVEGGSNA